VDHQDLGHGILLRGASLPPARPAGVAVQ